MMILPPSKTVAEYGGKYKHITREMLQAGIDAGKTIQQIAVELGIPRGSMIDLVRRHGLATGRKSGRKVTR